MYLPKLLPCAALLLLLCCAQQTARIESNASTDFVITVSEGDRFRELVGSGAIDCSSCSLAFNEVGGRKAIQLTTDAEFSDLGFDLEKLFGRTIDYGSGGYLYFDLFVPEGSEIMSVKFNHEGKDGSFGGCGNYFNNLYGNRGRWLSVEVPLEEQYDDCKRWTGEGDYLAEITRLTVNPYNADRVNGASLYVNNLRLSPDRIAGDYTSPRLSPRPEVSGDRIPYTITFDEPELLARQQAYRTFEATTQQIAAGKFGNPTRAIRSYGTGQNRYICLLPDIEQMTGAPVDFHRVDSLFFSYYLTPESDSVGGATLFITTGDDWEGMLMDSTFMRASDFRRGAWTRHAVALADLDPVPLREPLDVLSAVYELRIDLHYAKDAGPIEMWYDDIGWK